MPIINLHCFEKRGKYFLVDKYSRKYGTISAEEYAQVLDFKRRHTCTTSGELHVTDNDLNDIASALCKIDPKGTTTEKFDLPADIMASPSLSELKARKSILYLHVTGACNLRCPWCYTGEKVNVKLGETNVQHAIKSISQVGNGNNYLVRFFGGEPLMNMDLIQRSVAYCEQRPENFEYTITTNGLLLNRKHADFLVANDFLISISIMGYQEVHDEGRIFSDKSGSYYQVIERAQAFFQQYDHAKVSANITVPTGEFNYVKAIKNLMAVGFRRFKFIEIADGKEISDERYAREIEARNQLLDFYIETLASGETITLMGIGFDAYLQLIKQRNAVQPPMCPLHAEVSMEHNGNYTPCHRWVAEKFTNLPAVLERQKEIIESVDYSDCKSCWAEYVCGKGVCYWKKHHFEPDNPGPNQEQCRRNGRMSLIEGAFYINDYLENTAEHA